MQVQCDYYYFMSHVGCAEAESFAGARFQGPMVVQGVVVGASKECGTDVDWGTYCLPPIYLHGFTGPRSGIYQVLFDRTSIKQKRSRSYRCASNTWDAPVTFWTAFDT